MKANHLYVVKIDGMRCGSCKAHVNDVIRRNFDIKKVKSSHFFNKTKIYSDNLLDENKIKSVIGEEGYIVKDISHTSK